MAKIVPGIATVLALYLVWERAAAADDPPPAPAPASNSLLEDVRPRPDLPPTNASHVTPIPQSFVPATSVGSSPCTVCGNYHIAAPCPPSYVASKERRCRLCDPNASRNAIMRAAPHGSSLHSIMGLQVANGDAAQMVLYEFDFYPGTARLNCRGMLRLRELARELNRTPFPILIQPTLVDPSLDEARRKAVVEGLATFEPWVPEDRVLLGLPPARGLDGVDAVIVHERVLGLTTGGQPGAGVFAAPTPASAVPPAR